MIALTEPLGGSDSVFDTLYKLADGAKIGYTSVSCLDGGKHDAPHFYTFEKQSNGSVIISKFPFNNPKSFGGETPVAAEHEITLTALNGTNNSVNTEQHNKYKEQVYHNRRAAAPPSHARGAAIPSRHVEVTHRPSAAATPRASVAAPPSRASGTHARTVLRSSSSGSFEKP